MDVKRIAATTLLAIICATADAGLYKWVDENGQIHYSDKPRGGAASQNSTQAKEISIHDGLVIKNVTRKFPVRLSTKEKRSLRDVTFSDFRIRLPTTEGRQIKIGRESHGKNCSVAAIYYWDAHDLPLNDEAMGELINDTFTHYGYRYSNSLSSTLVLSGAIVAMKVDSCIPYGNSRTPRSKDAVYLKIDWQLKDSYRNETIYQGSTEGSTDQRAYNTRENGLIEAVDDAIKIAVRNLLADKSFVRSLMEDSGPGQHYDTSASSGPVFIRYTTHSGDFRSRVEYLEKLAVTIKTREGHGSGVLLDSKGHILTNAHVVKDSHRVKVTIGDKEFKAEVLKKMAKRDVALLKIHETTSLPQKIELSTAESDVIPGDEVYVIGTPLDVTLSETITKGIISAKRTIEGQHYLQTDAAVNPGNSGGPAFNANGELVAIAVAGVVDKNGATVNINYLIPIHDAMESLNIVTMEY